MKKKLPILTVKSKNQFLRSLSKGETTILDIAINSIAEGITKNRKVVSVFELNIKNLDTTLIFKLPRDKWNDILNQMLKKTIEHEQYEYSAKIQEQINKLELQTIKNQKNDEVL